MSRSLVTPVVAVCLMLCGCTTTGNNPPPSLFDTRHFGPNPPATPTASGVMIDTADAAKLETGDAKARIQDLGAMDTDAPAFVQNGYNNVYRLCNNYFDALIIAQNRTEFSNDVVTETGTSTAAIMGLAKSSASAIGIVAAGTALTSSLIQSYQNRALMTPYPNETKTLILAALDEYQKSAPPSSAHSKLDAVTLVQHYAEICTYSGISRYARLALNSSTVMAAKGTTSSNISTITTSIADMLGAPSLTDTNVEDLYYYLVESSTLWQTNVPAAQSLIKTFPASVQSQLVDQHGAPTDPTKTPGIPALTTFLKLLYGENSTFKSAADTETTSLAAAQNKAGGAPTPASTTTPSSAPLLVPRIMVNQPPAAAR